MVVTKMLAQSTMFNKQWYWHSINMIWYLFTRFSRWICFYLVTCFFVWPPFRVDDGSESCDQTRQRACCDRRPSLPHQKARPHAIRRVTPVVADNSPRCRKNIVMNLIYLYNQSKSLFAVIDRHSSPTDYSCSLGISAYFSSPYPYSFPETIM